MPAKNLFVATLIALLGSAALAAPSSDMPTSAELRAYTPVPRTRAEVIADLEVYRRSGLAGLDSSDSPDAFSGAYAEAQARYQAMRAAPAFKQRVARIARERGEAEATASSRAAVTAQ